MERIIQYTPDAIQQLSALSSNKSNKVQYKAVTKALAYLEIDTKHPSLHSHDNEEMTRYYGSKNKIFQSYAQNNTPGAYRIFWLYGPEEKEITVVAITQHS